MNPRDAEDPTGGSASASVALTESKAQSDSESKAPPESEVGAALRHERDARIARLEAKLSRPRGVGLSPLSAAAAMAVSSWFFFQTLGDAAYFFSPRAPVELGAEGRYRLETAADNRFARVHGSPAPRATYWREGAHTYVAVRLREVPLVVKRRALPSEAWSPGEVPPPPDPRPFEASGRLRSRGAEARFASVFSTHDELNELSPALWLLDTEERPGADLGAAVWTGVLAAAGCFSLWLFIRSVAARWQLTR